MKCYILTFLTFCSLSLLAQNGLSIIKNSDGFTNIRSGAGMNFKVIDTLFKEDFFYVKFDENSNWVKVTGGKGRKIKGFIHKSKVQEVKSLDNRTLKGMISEALDTQRNLADNFKATWKSKDSLSNRNATRKLEEYSDIKYDPILQVIPNYFCATNDAEIIDKFFMTMWANKGSANEMPSVSIGDCFICKTNIVIERLNKLIDKEQKILILDQIEWGLLNRFRVDEEGNSNNKEFNERIDRIKKERKKIKP